MVETLLWTILIVTVLAVILLLRASNKALQLPWHSAFQSTFGRVWH